MSEDAPKTVAVFYLAGGQIIGITTAPDEATAEQQSNPHAAGRLLISKADAQVISGMTHRVDLSQDPPAIVPAV